MTTTNIIRKTHPLFILGMTLGACQGVDSDRPGAGLGDVETSGTTDDDDDYDEGGNDGDGDGDDGDSGSADGSSESDGGAEAGCGNGVVEAGEQCDDDNDDDLDACLSDCRFGPTGLRIDGSMPRVLPQYGNLGGGGAHDDGCPNGEVIMGIKGREGAVLDQVQVMCGLVQLFDPEDPDVLDLTIVPGTVLPQRGGDGGGGFTRTCPEGYAVVGFSGRSGHLVDKLILSCARMVVVDDGQSMALGFEEPIDLAGAGGGGGNPFEPGHCGEGEVATIANIRSGSMVDAFGLTCMPISLLF